MRYMTPVAAQQLAESDALQDLNMKSILLILAALVALGTAEIVHTRKCPNVDRDICKVNQVRIEPCGTKKKNRCEVFQNDTETLNFDFTPNFVATTLKSQVSWQDKPFNIEPDDACTLTSCPTEVGKQQTFNYRLFINQALPEGSFTIKWKVWNGENESQVCCFMTNLRITKPN